ncbi:MAG: DNA translocase FtsK [Phycisphaerales bacterium]|nr:DNA translocase FtsK [Phycisphaerae bacterium]NNF43106.1 DNA translocase FtsK [Phycisphaerales bacterium]NNM27340.1 DNA translocase FtsK [Phycisphaerales bacterium]
MAKRAVNARRIATEDELTPVELVGRAGWLATAVVWLFAVVAFATFDSADWPSHAVAVHNDPTANLCGTAGAVVAYGGYHVIGIGVWVLLLGAAAGLTQLARGRAMGHVPLRLLGWALAAVCVSGFHAVLFPRTGPLAATEPGLLAQTIVASLLPRFATVGTLLALAAGLGVGGIVAADRAVLAVPRLLGRTIRLITAWPQAIADGATALFERPRAVLAAGAARLRRPDDPEHADHADDEDDEYEYEDEYEGDEDDEYEYEDEYEDDEADEDEAAEPTPAEIAVAAEESTEPARARLTAAQLREKISKLPVRMASRNKTVARDEDIPRTDNFKNYQFPTLELLKDPETNFSQRMESFVRKQAEHLEESLHTYGIDAEVVGIESGPAVTLYSVQLAPGTKVSKVSAISSDIARSLRTQNIRIVPNMVGRTAIGIEVPNATREKVRLKELMSGGHANGMVLPMFLGKDSSGEPLVADLTRMPHMLIAGTTGSGKSVCMNSILMSWLYTKRPDELKLVLFDPKMVEMSQFADVPHLMCPVVTETLRATAIMEWAVERMEERYELLQEARVQNIAAYNKLTEGELYELFEAETEEEKARIPKKLPYMVFVVDELADMMMTCKEVEHSIVRIAQKARAVGIHLILATQRPQANVVTGLIKSNMPCRVSFKVASGMDSRIVLDSKGAELLLGQGDMMFLTPHTSEIMRAQGTLVEDTEIRKVARYLKQVAVPSFERSLMAVKTASSGGDGLPVDERDPLFDDAVRVMIESGRGSVSLLQRRLSIGYGRASRLVDQMGQAGILGDHKGSVAREVMITLEEWEQMRAIEESGGLDDELDDELDEPPVIETSAGEVVRH